MANKGYTAPEELRRLMKNLNKEIKAIRGASAKGLIKAAKIIKRDMETTPPLTPVDLGNLRSSLFIVTAAGAEVGNDARFKGKTPAEKRRAARMQGEHSSILGSYKELARGSKKEVLYMGYTANYAQAVHEKSNTNTKWKRKGSGAKWFQEAVNRNYKKILETVRDNTRNR